MRSMSLVKLLALVAMTGAVLDAQSVKTGKVEGDFSSAIKVKTRGKTSQKDLVIYLVPQGKLKKELAIKPPKEPVQVVQRRLDFIPHVLPVVVGSKVTFRNKDKVRHNILSRDKCCPVDKDMAGQAAVTLTYAKPGQASVICRLHPEMSMHVLVLETPIFTATEIKKKKIDGKRTYLGNYALNEVPAGSYVLKTWNKKLPSLSIPVEVKAGETTKVDLRFAKKPAAKPSK